MLKPNPKSLSKNESERDNKNYESILYIGVFGDDYSSSFGDD